MKIPIIFGLFLFYFILFYPFYVPWPLDIMMGGVGTTSFVHY